ncbi:MAG: DNA repair protein RadC [Desulfomicrobium escambiense]|nr:DNA repair protein RadC [Desulfomicrobium escambiense]
MHTTTVPVCTDTPDPQADDRRRAEEDAIIAQALAILAERLRTADEPALTSPDAARHYLQLRLGQLEYEVFGMLWLDNRHRVVAIEELFRGTIDGASVYPREVVKAGLRCNGAAALAFHNHPSGVSEPSADDLRMTRRLREALALVDIRLLDHLIVGDTCLSLAERGLL